MDCGGMFAKYVLFIANILFVIFGILLIVFGSLIVADFHGVEFTEAGVLANKLPIFIIVLGCIIFFISFLGCCGSMREDDRYLKMYSVIMLVLLIVTILLVAFVWLKKEEVMEGIGKGVVGIWHHYETDPLTMNVLQTSLQCCGMNGPVDYEVKDGWPASCCKIDQAICNFSNAYKTGCLQAANKFFADHINIMRITGLGIVAVEMVAFIFSCCLVIQIRNDIRRLHY